MPALMMVAQVAAAPASVLMAPMAASAAGWNAGDLAAFVAIYADDAVYVTSKGVVKGKPAIASRYASSFRGGGNIRGRLSFSPLVEQAIDPTHRLLVARWTLTGAKVESGMTTLLFERRGPEWKIIADHSS